MANEEQFKQLISTNEEFRNKFSTLNDEQKKEFIVKFTSPGQQQPSQQEQGFVDKLAGRVFEAQPQTEQKIAERGEAKILQPIQDIVKGEGSRVMNALNLVAAPFQRIEAAMANPLIAASKGDFKNIPESMLQGITGERIGEFGDVYRNVGVPDAAAAALGFSTDALLAGGLLEHGVKSLRKGIIKGGDKLAVKSVNQILSGVNKTEKATIASTNKFWKGIDDIQANVTSALDEIANLPKNAIKIMERELGKNIESVTNLADVRKLKQTLGFLKSNAFSKVERGLTNTLDELKVNDAYRSLSKLIGKTLEDNNLSKQAKKLIKVNDNAENIINSAKVVKRNLMKSTGELKIDNAITKLIERGGGDFRIRLNNLANNKVSRKATREIKKGVSSIRTIAADDAFAKFMQSIPKAALRVGAIGGVAGLTGIRSARNSKGDGGIF
jgi:hypothetical protein